MNSNQANKFSFIYRKGFVMAFMLVLAMFLSVHIPSSVQAVESDFEIEDGVLIGYHGKDKNVVIPSSVKKIAASAFTWNETIVSVMIPSSVKSIENWGEPIGAFACCTNLQSVNLPNTITSLPQGVFSDCTSLNSITIPNSVKKIGKWSFAACTGLTSVTIPESVEKIGEWTFTDCTNLKSITIPKSVKKMGSNIFQPWRKKAWIKPFDQRMRWCQDWLNLVGCSS